MNVAVVGVQWGDEGKGKVVDHYGRNAEYIVRFQGGNNAGHTLVVDGVQTILHLIPSGVLHPGRKCLIANGVVFDPTVFFEEVEALEKVNAPSDRPDKLIHVSERTHIVMPYHRALDKYRETLAAGGKGEIGTTSRGIGPAYEDKVARRGIQAIDLIRPKLLKEKLERAIEEKNVLFEHLFAKTNSDVQQINFSEVYEECLSLGRRLKPYITDVRSELLTAVREGKNILFEGAQGALLDVDHGTYPYVTSSNVIAGGVLAGCGLGPGIFDDVVGLVKAYCTRVGTGPFPTELMDTENGGTAKDKEDGDRLQKIGAEFGATTGRRRRTGWLDLVALRYAAEINGLTGIALTKVDVLSSFDEVKICTAYELDGKKIETFPTCVEDLELVRPVYETFKGWGQLSDALGKGGAITRSDLPEALNQYISRIEEFTKVPVILVSTGPGREQTLELKNPFQASK